MAQSGSLSTANRDEIRNQMCKAIAAAKGGSGSLPIEYGRINVKIVEGVNTSLFRSNRINKMIVVKNRKFFMEKPTNNNIEQIPMSRKHYREKLRNVLNGQPPVPATEEIRKMIGLADPTSTETLLTKIRELKVELIETFKTEFKALEEKRMELNAQVQQAATIFGFDENDLTNLIRES